jgi:hypothetical protein
LAATAIEPLHCSRSWTSGRRFVHWSGSRTRSSITALPDPGARALNACDELLAILDDSDHRKQLSALGVKEARESQLFTRIAEPGKDFKAGLPTLLFDDPELRHWVRDYLLF